MPRKSAKKKTAPPSIPSSPSGKQRLQRVLASAGFGSRRQCEDLIEEGRVSIQGEVVTKLGVTVDPSSTKILVDGVPLKKQKLVYYAVNKPVGVVTTNRDPKGRPRVIDLVPPSERVFPVGRLDRSSEGLILLTNDGDLAQRLAHPKYGVRKVYRVTVAGKVDSETMRKMRKGIYISEGLVRVDGAKILKARSRSTDMEIVLREGKNREIRRILARFGHKVQTLQRIAIGPLRLGDVPAGAYRVVKREEVQKLQRESVIAQQTREKEDDQQDGSSSRKGVAKRGRGGSKKSSRANTTGGLKNSKRATKRTASTTAGKRASKKRSFQQSTKKTGKKTAKKTAKKRATATSKKRGRQIDVGKVKVPGLASKPVRSGAIIGGDSPRRDKVKQTKPKRRNTTTKRVKRKR